MTGARRLTIRHGHLAVGAQHRESSTELRQPREVMPGDAVAVDVQRVLYVSRANGAATSSYVGSTGATRSAVNRPVYG